MKTRRADLVYALALLLPACATVGTGAVNAPGPSPEERDGALLEALRVMANEVPDLEQTRAFYAFQDLNDDGVHEAVVHMTGSAYCGTGGCTTMVYQWDSKAGRYAKVDHSPTTRPPIYASRRKGCQWSILWVQRSGGGGPPDRHSPNPLSDVDSCDAPTGTWSEAESKLLIPEYESRAFIDHAVEIMVETTP